MRTRWAAASVLSAVTFVVLLRLGVRASLPSSVMGVLAPLSLLALVASAFRAGVEHGFVDPSRPLFRRHGFWLVAIGTVLALPTLGSSGLIDPWETHYAEVAREMIERRDFVSPWWANEGWFMSKPILTFWLEAIAMVVFGVRTGPDQVLSGMAHPEWAVRFPGFALALLGSYVLYRGVASACGRRAAFFGAVVLWTMPGFALLSHQAMTDMPLVAGVAASLGLLVSALATSDAVLATRQTFAFRGREIQVHLGHALALFAALVTLPQIVMLLLEHLHAGPSGLRIGPDRLLAGSPHACTLPGQPACANSAIAHPRLSPALQATLWTPAALWLISRAASETRVARLFVLGAWACAAFAAMAKGPAGLAVPAAAALVQVIARRSPRSLLRLEIPVGLVLAVTMIAPWYVAAYARHGKPFIDELVFRHMLGRTLDHLHDTNDGEDVGIVYFVRQLAYASFPWSGVAVLGVMSAIRGDGKSDVAERGTARAVLFGAALVSFALVSSMRTKFHHYALIALPPIAMLAGLFIDEALAIARSGFTKARAAWVATALAFASCTVAIVGQDVATIADGARGPARFILLLTYRYTRAWPSTTGFGATFAAMTIGASVAIGASVVHRLRIKAIGGVCGAAFLFVVVLLDVYLPRCAADGGQRDVMLAYYSAREDTDRAPLVAYQLNWKGENFYTGNHLAIFITSGPPMKNYLDHRRESGERTVFFVTERGRVTTLQRELGGVRSFAELTGPRVSAEFTLVRVEL